MPEQEQQAAAAIEDCSHRWMIESPNGPTSMGKCMDCGAEGEFKNSVPISGWDRDGSRAKKNAANKSASAARAGTKSG